jgi:hypothetical protein
VNRTRTRKIAAGAAVALLAAGGGVAYAASSESPSNTREHVWGPGPGAYGYAMPTEPPEPGASGARGERRLHFGGPAIAGPGAPFEGAADYLGLDEDELLRRLRNGRTLREIATAEGRSVDGLKSALVEAARERLDEAVEDGPLTAEDRDRVLADVEERIDDVVDARLLQGGPRFRGGDGPGFHHFRGGCGPADGDERAVPPPSDRRDEGGSGRSDERSDEQGGSTVPGSWGGAASGTVSA